MLHFFKERVVTNGSNGRVWGTVSSQGKLSNLIIYMYTHMHTETCINLYETVQEQFCQRDNHLLESYIVLTG